MICRCFVYLTTIVLISACAPTAKTKGSYINLAPPITTPAEVNETSLADIRVFYQEKPDFEFTEIGIIEALVYGSDAGLKDLFSELKKQAILAGGKAIYKIDIKRHNLMGDTLQATAVAVTPK